jgi:hypothetical protein
MESSKMDVFSSEIGLASECSSEDPHDRTDTQDILTLQQFSGVSLKCEPQDRKQFMTDNF